MFNQMPSINQIVLAISVAANVQTPDDEQFKKIWSIAKSLKDESSCLTFKYIGEKFKTKEILNNPYKQFVYQIKFSADHKFTVDKNVTVYMHHRNMLNSGQDNAFLHEGEIKNGSSKSIYLTYDRYRSELLEWPYRSNCRYYSKTSNFQSQGHCIDYCRIVNTNQELSFISSQCLIEEDDRYPKEVRFDEWSDYDNQTVKDKLAAIDNLCINRTCSNQDCIRTEFVPMVRKEINAKQFSISVKTARGPDFKVKFAPAINLIDFVTYVLSTIGFWTGFAPLSLQFYQRTKFSKSLKGHQKRSKSSIEPLPSGQTKTGRRNVYLYDMIRKVELSNDLEKQFIRKQIDKIFNHLHLKQ